MSFLARFGSHRAHRRAGGRRDTREDEDEAFEILDREGDVALVVMDLMMPEQDGYEATRRLRANPRLRHLPVIALTAKAMPGDREKALAAGCNDLVLKPVERDELIGVLRAWLERPLPTRAS